MEKEEQILKNERHKIRPIHCLYLISLFFVGVLLMCIFLTRTTDYNDQTEKRYDDISDKWRIVPEGLEEIDFRHLGQYCDKDAKTLYIYCEIPKMEHDTTLFYRSKDVYTSLYVDDMLIYETSVPDSRFYNRSPGNLWNEVLLDKSYSGKMLIMKIDIVYDTKAVTVDSFFFGNGTNIVRNYVKEKIVDIFVSLLMVLVGIIFVIINFLSQNKNVYMGHGLLYLGIYASLIGAWCLLETNVLQLFVSDQRILQLCNNLLMVTAMLPLFLFLDYTYDVFKKPLTRFLCICNLIYIFVCVFAQLSGICDVHKLIHGIEISVVVSIILFGGWVVHSVIDFKKKRRNLLSSILQMCGIGFLMISVAIELITYNQGDLADRAGVLRVGVLFFIVFFGISSQVQTKHLMINGLRYDVVKNLAYSDGLTNIGNRTAYLEKLDSYVGSELCQVGIIYFDINNLKYVNDTFGHKYGDELIKCTSHILEKSFGTIGNCYRIGGDEFCVLVDKDLPTDLYNNAVEIFEILMKEANEEKSFPFDISVARGFSVCNEMTKEKLKQAIDEADIAMYENKKEIKKF